MTHLANFTTTQSRAEHLRILPVLDILGGVVVRGVGGRRQEYRPIVSRLTRSAIPLDVARAIQSEYGLSEFYLADLDAISGASPSVPLYTQLRDAGFRLWIDAGLRFADDAEPLLAAGVEQVVFGLETLDSSSHLSRACERHGPRIIFSLDLRNGEPLGNREAWNHGDAFTIAEQAVTAGANHIIILDLARVGVGTGVGTEELCHRVAQAFPNVEIIAGGGVRGIDELQRLHECGARGVLLASILHDRRITPEHLAEFAHRR
jgi:phosphoribosylformimino-5-aminoimidazole carboxamide ribotide isomerase